MIFTMALLIVMMMSTILTIYLFLSSRHVGYGCYYGWIVHSPSSISGYQVWRSIFFSLLHSFPDNGIF